ncbi:hypothetical protein U3516DRAFT_735779 [Neocallimastix sp. 'constans']
MIVLKSTIFTTKLGSYRFKVMPFSLTGAPAALIYCINKLKSYIMGNSKQNIETQTSRHTKWYLTVSMLGIELRYEIRKNNVVVEALSIIKNENEKVVLAIITNYNRSEQEKELIENLIGHRANINKEINKKELIEYLMKHDDVKSKEYNDNGCTSKRLKIETYNRENDIYISSSEINKLIKNSNIDELKNIFYISKFYDNEFIKWLLLLHKNINVKSKMVEKGANINKENKDGETPLFMAINSGNNELVKYLVKQGADISKEDYYDKIP